MIVAYFGAMCRITSKRSEHYYEVNKKAAILVYQLRFNVAYTYAVLKTLQKNYFFLIHMSVRRNIITNYSQQIQLFLNLFIFIDVLHVSGGSSAHHQEHITVHTASGIVNQ